MKRILLVDDEAHILHVVRMKLERAGFEVLTAMDGEEALEVCRAELPDLLITDCQMPLMSGLELVSRLRQEEKMHDMPVIMLSARSFELTDEQSRQASINVLISKPFSPKELLSHVNRLLPAQAAQADK